MNLDRFLRDRAPSWDELDALVARAGTRPERLAPGEVRELGRLYRSASADLAAARRSFGSDPVRTRLEGLVARSRHLVYASEARRGSVLDFVTTGYWRRVCERRVPLLVSALLLFGPLLIGFVWARSDPAGASGIVPGALAPVTEPRPRGADLGLSLDQRSAFAAQIFTNNIRVAFVAFAGGISAGILTGLALVFNGLVIGVVSALATAAGQTDVFLQLIVPHGVLELSCIVVAGAAGLRVGWALIDPGYRSRGDALAEEARAAVELVLGTAAWLVVAGLVEGFVTPAGWGLVPSFVVGFGLGILFWALAVTRGRGARGAPSPSP